MKKHMCIILGFTLGLSLFFLMEGIFWSRVSAGSEGTGLADSAWPCERHDVKRTGRSPYVGAQTNSLKWSYPLGELVRSSPTVGKDNVLYLGNGNKVFALNPDGRLKWVYEVQNQYITVSPPVVASDGTLYFGTGNFNHLYALNSDGSLRWSYPTEEDGSGEPLIGPDGVIYFGGYYKVYALHPDGSLKWSNQIGDFISSSPAMGTDGTIFIGSFDGKLYALDSEDGSFLWACPVYPVGCTIRSPAVGNDGTVYVGNTGYGLDGKVYAIGPNGNLQWSYQTGGNISSSPALGEDGTIYIGNCEGASGYGLNDGNKVFAINPDGSLKWAYLTGNSDEDSILSSPAVGADGTIYIGCDNGKVYALNPDGSLKWSYQTGGKVSASASIGADGTVYNRNIPSLISSQDLMKRSEREAILFS